jgi:hypothetical protein
MSEFPTIILVPFIVAFLVFILRFYSRESASSMTNPSFLMAVGTVLTAGTFLILRITDLLPPYSTIGFGAIGLVLMLTAFTRMFMI